jgi:hypothetical protein
MHFWCLFISTFSRVERIYFNDTVSQLYVAESLSTNYKLKTMWRKVAVSYLRNYSGIIIVIIIII